MTDRTETTGPNIWTRLAYWLLVRASVFLQWRRKQAWKRYRAWDSCIEIVHRPIHILGARYMKELVNGD